MASTHKEQLLLILKSSGMKKKNILILISIVTIFTIGSLFAAETNCIEDGCASTYPEKLYEWSNDINLTECTNHCVRDSDECCETLHWRTVPN